MTGREGTIPSLFCCPDPGVCLHRCVFGVVLYMPHVTHFTLTQKKGTDMFITSNYKLTLKKRLVAALR